MASPRCARVREVLSSHLDGELDPSTRLFVDEHLSTCDSCAAEAETLRVTSAIAQGAPRFELPKGFHADLVQRARAEAATVAAAARLRSPAGAPGFGQGLAAFLGGLGASFKQAPVRAITATAAALVLVVFIGVFAFYMGVDVPGHDLFGLKRDKGSVTDISSSGEQGSAPGASSGAPSLGVGGSAGKDTIDLGLAATDQGSATTGFGNLTGTAGRQFILSVYLALGCDKVAETKDRAVATAERAGGYVESLNYWTDANGLTSATLVLRVPAASLSVVLKDLRGLGELVSEQASRFDVTTQHIDLAARVKNLRLQEERLLTLLGRAQDLTDLFAIESELARVRTEVEIYESQLRMLDEQIALSSVSLTLQPKGTGLLPEAGIWEKLVAAFLRSIKWLAQLGGQVLVLAASALVPLALLALSGWGVHRYVVARRRRAGM